MKAILLSLGLTSASWAAAQAPRLPDTLAMRKQGWEFVSFEDNLSDSILDMRYQRRGQKPQDAYQGFLTQSFDYTKGRLALTAEDITARRDSAGMVVTATVTHQADTHAVNEAALIIQKRVGKELVTDKKRCRRYSDRHEPWRDDPGYFRDVAANFTIMKTALAKNPRGAGAVFASVDRGYGIFSPSYLQRRITGRKAGR